MKKKLWHFNAKTVPVVLNKVLWCFVWYLSAWVLGQVQHASWFCIWIWWWQVMKSWSHTWMLQQMTSENVVLCLQVLSTLYFTESKTQLRNVLNSRHNVLSHDSFNMHSCNMLDKLDGSPLISIFQYQKNYMSSCLVLLLGLIQLFFLRKWCLINQSINQLFVCLATGQ
jgi:hypothetical protein